MKKKKSSCSWMGDWIQQSASTVNLDYFRLGSWQFMADMPYTCVSVDSMWQLLWILHQGQDQVVNLDQLPPVKSCMEYMQGECRVFDAWFHVHWLSQPAAYANLQLCKCAYCVISQPKNMFVAKKVCAYFAILAGDEASWCADSTSANVPLAPALMCH